MHESNGTKGFRASLFWKSNSFSSIHFFFKVLRTKKKLFSHCQENLTLVILEEEMREENGDRTTDEWRLARDREEDREREEGWTSGSQWWNGRLIWNEFEELVQVKVTIYITVPDYSSHLSVHRRKDEKRREGKIKEMIYNYKWRAEKRADRGEVCRKL